MHRAFLIDDYFGGESYVGGPEWFGYYINKYVPPGEHKVTVASYCYTNGSIVPGVPYSSIHHGNYQSNMFNQPGRSIYTSKVDLREAWLFTNSVTDSVIQSGLFFGTSNGYSVPSVLSQADDLRLYILCDENMPNGQIESRHQHIFNENGAQLDTETSATREDLTEQVEVYVNRWSNGSASAPVWRTFGYAATTYSETKRSYYFQAPPYHGPQHYYPARTAGNVRSRVTWIPNSDLEAADGWMIGIDQISFRTPLF